MQKTASQIADIVLEKCAEQLENANSFSAPALAGSTALGGLAGGAAGAVNHFNPATVLKDMSPSDPSAYIDDLYDVIGRGGDPIEFAEETVRKLKSARNLKALGRIGGRAAIGAGIGGLGYGAYKALSGSEEQDA